MISATNAAPIPTTIMGNWEVDFGVGSPRSVRLVLGRGMEDDDFRREGVGRAENPDFDFCCCAGELTGAPSGAHSRQATLLWMRTAFPCSKSVDIRRLAHL